MKQPSIWKQIKDENASFVSQFSSENEYEKAGLTRADQMLVLQKRESKVLHGVTRGPDAQWQVRFTLSGKQEILFACYSLPVSALIRDLLLTRLLKYPHCWKSPGNPLLTDSNKENGIFNFPLGIRIRYHGPEAENRTVKDFLERVEKILLDRGTLYALTSEELAAREQIASQSKTHADSAAQKRYQTRRATQLDEILGHVRAFGEASQSLDKLCVRQNDFLARAGETEARINVVSQQFEFAVGQLETLKRSVDAMTATLQNLLDEARKP